MCGSVYSRIAWRSILLIASLLPAVWLLAAEDDGAAAKTPWTEAVVPPAARSFWSFRPLQQRKPPVVQHEGLVNTPVDRFVLERLEAKGLSLNPTADRVDLIRRAYFDLVGVPPSPEEIAEFFNDRSADPWGNLIDRLLANPQYGERWARHWLDVARFAESHGFEHDYDRPTAYFYRDFVIQALNQDLAYDKFVKWQIAGDEYAPNDNLALMATGFLAAGVHSTQITKNEVEKHRYDELDDILSTIGSSILGLSIGCARCHDHKYDPIPQRDYYRLLATFTTTVRSEVDLDLDPAGYQKAQAAFAEQHAPYVAALAKYETEQLPGKFAAWERENQGTLASAPWIILDPATMKSEGGATLTRQGDGSILAGGANPRYDTYTITVKTKITGMKSLRIEALADPSLPNKGPGRAPNSNFDLTDLKVTAAALPDKDGDPAPAATRVVLKNPRATFEQPGLPIAAAIDGNENSGWAVDPQFGKSHAAAFDFETPVDFQNGSLLTITLVFKGNDQHNFGRTRLAVSTAAEPVDLNAAGFSQQVLEALAIPAEKRSAEEQQTVLRWFAATHDSEWQKLNQAAAEHLAQAPKPTIAKAMISTEGLPAVRLHTQGGDFLEQTHFLRRGDPNQKEAVATPGFLQVLMPTDGSLQRWEAKPPAGWRTSYRRTAFAEWLCDTEQGAGNLLARVIVNRMWQHHFGRGLVATPNDFGMRGAPPTHPELLDWLAGELIRNGWSLKKIHKLLMTSAVYRQSSQFDEARAAVDRENTLLWRSTPRRLEAEVIRDSLLAVSGLLDKKMFGPGTLDEASRRRSIYFTVKRSKLVAMMQTFDAPDALSSIGERPTTTIAPQALLLMNNANTRQFAKAFAARVLGQSGDDPATAIQRAYLAAVARPPSPDELADALAFLSAQTTSYQSAGNAVPREAALADLCQVLLCLNEFVFVE